jgi:hypothetical protein
LDALPADGERRYLLRIVLVQAIVHSRRVGGTVRLQLEGVRDGQTVSLDVASLVADGDDYDMAYEFRYFQGLECEIVLPVGFEPQKPWWRDRAQRAARRAPNQSLEGRHREVR